MPTGIYIRTEKAKENMRKAHIGLQSKEKHPLWKGDLTNNKEYRKSYNKKWKEKHPDYYAKYSKKKRHEKGISKRYNSELGISHTKEYKKLQRQKRKAFMKGGGKLEIKTIQLVYEDNIKQYGTLTCYLCLKPIPFGKDHLEHKMPLSRGGTNEYNNLAIACQKCNCSKHNKTEKEYRKE
jgi:5-methylcytosine-specific restriction endonuclease McrA